MQSVSRTAVAAAAQPPRALSCSARPPMSRAAGGGRALATALRARCGGGVEPVETREDGCAPGDEEVDAVLAPEELEMLEDEAMGGGDEGRRPTDYDRRAHIFEESSRVFRALKQHRDCDDCDGGGAVAATAADTARGRHEAPRLE